MMVAIQQALLSSDNSYCKIGLAWLVLTIVKHGLTTVTMVNHVQWY